MVTFITTLSIAFPVLLKVNNTFSTTILCQIKVLKRLARVEHMALSRTSMFANCCRDGHTWTHKLVSTARFCIVKFTRWSCKYLPSLSLHFQITVVNSKLLRVTIALSLPVKAIYRCSLSRAHIEAKNELLDNIYIYKHCAVKGWEGYWFRALVEKTSDKGKVRGVFLGNAITLKNSIWKVF